MSFKACLLSAVASKCQQKHYSRATLSWARTIYMYVLIIESVDSISRVERVFPLTQYITNGEISRAGYTVTHFKHHHRVLQLISNRIRA